MSIIIKNIENSSVKVRVRDEEPSLSREVKLALVFLVAGVIALILVVTNRTDEHPHRGPVTTTYINHDKYACTNEQHFDSKGRHR